MNSSIARSTALLLARIALGVIFVAHGWQKVSTNGLDATKAGFEAMDVPAPALSAYFAAYVELIGGAALIIGALVPLVGLLLFIDMAGALLTVHLDKGLFASGGGYELVLILGATSLLIAVLGSGKFGVDALFGRGGVDATKNKSGALV
ncbi:DoxX family protein [Antrihabitans sp. YC3-6]|uniref:DoxX family protein n=1 Tax=Antrihabitans stalagmiti TaxID=2799499 RepID=A0A934U505_9NOCA|nr:DoxX family protein [Antrihabitans stalagmiti]MBJ8340951.1 DoxX family protein [Antrihabitans stalagmiti]